MRVYNYLVLLCIFACASTVMANGGDVCPGPLISSLPYIDSTGNTTNANSDYGHCGIQGSRDVIYTLRLPCTYSVTASLCGSNLSSYISILTGPSCPGDSLVACDAFACGNQRGQVTFTAEANRDYFVMVYGRCSALQCYFGTYTLSITGTAVVPANDACPGSTIAALPYTDAGSTCAALPDYAYCNGVYDPDVVYTLNVPDCQLVTVSTCGSAFNTMLDVKAGGLCPGNYNVLCNDDNNTCGVFSQQSWLRFVAAANTNYYIVVSGAYGNSGGYILNVSGEPFVASNDACPGTMIPSLPYGDYGNTGCATTYTYNHCGGSLARDVVYNMTLPNCDRVFAFTCGSGYDTRLDVRAGGDCPGSVLVACNDDSAYCTAYGNQYGSAVVFDAYAGVTYYLIVHGYASAEGPFSLQAISLGGGPIQGDSCPAKVISSLPYSDVGSTNCLAPDFQNCLGSSSGDEIYRYQLNSGCQLVTVSLCGSGYDTGLTIRRGGSCPGSVLVACNDDSYCGATPTLQSSLSFMTSPAVPYYIIVHGYSWLSSGPYVMHVTGGPCDSTARVDSLVIMPSSSSIYLQWASQGPAYWYKVYRATTPDVPLNTTTYIDSTPNPYYYDIQVLNNPATLYFYAVTAATLPTMLGNGDDNGSEPVIDKATAASTSAPTFESGTLEGAASPEIDKSGPSAAVPGVKPAR